MFRRRWEEGTATVVDSVIDKAYAGVPGGPVMYVTYVVDVRPDAGEMFRAQVRHPEGLGIVMLDRGDTVRVRYRPGKDKVEIVEKGDPRFDPAVQRSQDEARVDELMRQAPGSHPPLR